MRPQAGFCRRAAPFRATETVSADGPGNRYADVDI